VETKWRADEQAVFAEVGVAHPVSIGLEVRRAFGVSRAVSSGSYVKIDLDV
jgi:hypothetical protein